MTLDGANNIDESIVAPKAGDLTVCMYCATSLEFVSVSQLRKLDAAQIEALEPELRAGLARGHEIAALWKIFNRELRAQLRRPS